MPFRPLFYKDLNKRSNDLLTKDFPSDKKENKVDWKGETSTQMTFETTLVQKNDGSILGTFSPKYRLKDWNTTLTGELKTNKDYKAELAIDNHFTPGLKTTLTEECRGEDLYTTAAIEYKHDLVAVTGSVEYGNTSGTTDLKASAVTGTQGFSLGSSLNYFMGSSNDASLREFNATAMYTNDDFDLGFYGKILNEKDSNILGAFYYQRVNTDLQVGTDVSFDTQNPDTKPKLTAGAQYRIDNDSYAKLKVDTSGKVGVSWTQKFKTSRLTLSATTDTNNLGGKSSSIGFNLSLF